MKFALDKQHRDFFQKRHFIEFENLISKEQLVILNDAIDQSLSNRIDLTSMNSDQNFLKGRDLWRENTTLQKFVCQPRLAQLASDLLEKKPIRLGYDQLFPTVSFQNNHLISDKKTYQHFLNQEINLGEMSSVSNLICGVMICLSPPKSNNVNNVLTDHEIDIFPNQAGNVIFFQPNLIYKLEQLYEHPEQRYFLIVYTQGLSFYYPQPKDPLGHLLKHLGYVFNDKLLDKLHPIILR